MINSNFSKSWECWLVVYTNLFDQKFHYLRYFDHRRLKADNPLDMIIVFPPDLNRKYFKMIQVNTPLH